MNPEAESTQQEPLPYLEMGTGFIIGLSIGYVVKKSFKLLLFFLGIGIIIVFVLESKGTITLNEANLEHIVSSAVDLFQDFVLFLKQRVQEFQVSSGVSAITGFIIGLKIG